MTQAKQLLHLHPVRADGSLQYVAMQMPALRCLQGSAKNIAMNNLGSTAFRKRERSYSNDILFYKMPAAFKK